MRVLYGRASLGGVRERRHWTGVGGMGGLPKPAAPFVAPGPCGVAIRTRLKDLTPGDEKVLALVGAHLGSLASRDLKARCADGLEHSTQTWAARKQELTAASSSRWAGSITKATHDQWALARRGQSAHDVPRHPDRPAADCTRARRHRCRHERRPPRRLAPRRTRQPDRPPAPLRLRPIRQPGTSRPRRPARNTGARSASGSSSPACLPAGSAPG